MKAGGFPSHFFWFQFFVDVFLTCLGLLAWRTEPVSWNCMKGLI